MEQETVVVKLYVAVPQNCSHCPVVVIFFKLTIHLEY